jgi:hypothetical protein
MVGKLMLKLDKIQAGPETLNGVKKILREHFEAVDEVEGIYSVSGGGINDANHVVAKTASGRQFGVKTRARGGGAQGEKREVAFSKACHDVGIPESSNAVLVSGIPSLNGFEKDQCVITEWRPGSKRPNEITDEEKKEIEQDPGPVMAQVGKWVAVNLHLGLGDRAKHDNWVWSHKERQLTAVDAESSFQTASVGDHRVIIDAFYGVAKLKTERGKSVAAKAFEAALHETHRRFRNHASSVGTAAKFVDSTNAYTSPYAHLTEDQFAEKVFSEL